MTDTVTPSNEGPAAELVEPHAPRLGLGEALARLTHGWNGTTYTESADADGTVNPERRDGTGQTPDPITAPNEPFTADDIGGHPARPMLVHVVDPEPVEQARPSTWAPMSVNVDGTPRRIVGQNPDRYSIDIANTGGSAVYLAPSENALQDDSSRYTLPPGASLAMTHTGEVWSATAGATVPLSIAAELS